MGETLFGQPVTSQTGLTAQILLCATALAVLINALCFLMRVGYDWLLQQKPLPKPPPKPSLPPSIRLATLEPVPGHPDMGIYRTPQMPKTLITSLPTIPCQLPGSSLKYGPASYTVMVGEHDPKACHSCQHSPEALDRSPVLVKIVWSLKIRAGSNGPSEAGIGGLVTFLGRRKP